MTHVLRIVCIYFVRRLVFPWLHPAQSSTSGTLLFPSPTFSAAETASLAPCGPSREFERMELQVLLGVMDNLVGTWIPT